MVLSPKQKPALHVEARSLGVSGMMWMIAKWRASMLFSPKQKPALHVEPSGLGLSGMSSRLTHIGTCTKCRERERERETERQRDRETERQRDRETERQRDRETERQRDRETDRQRDRETERQRDRERERDRETERQRDRERERETCTPVLSEKVSAKHFLSFGQKTALPKSVLSKKCPRKVVKVQKSALLPEDVIMAHGSIVWAWYFSVGAA